MVFHAKTERNTIQIIVEYAAVLVFVYDYFLNKVAI